MAGTKMPIALAASIPPIAGAHHWRATEPAPVAVHNGTQPRMNANEVIKIGRKRNPRAFQRRVFRRGFSVFVLLLGELHDQNRVLSS